MRAIGVRYHTQLAKVSSDETFDLTDGVWFFFFWWSQVSPLLSPPSQSLPSIIFVRTIGLAVGFIKDVTHHRMNGRSYVRALLFFALYFFTHIYFPASGKSRGHRRRPFSPPVLAFHLFIAHHRVQQNPLTARRVFIECGRLTLSRFPRVNLSTRKSPNEFIRVCTRRGSNSQN